MKLSLGEIGLWVRDLDKTSKFYTEALGFEEYERGEGYLKLRRDGITLCCFPCKKSEAMPAMGTAPMMTMDLMTDDLKGAVKALKAAGAEVRPVKENENHLHTIFRDKDGITWELIQKLS